MSQLKWRTIFIFTSQAYLNIPVFNTFSGKRNFQDFLFGPNVTKVVRVIFNIRWKYICKELKPFDISIPYTYFTKFLTIIILFRSLQVIRFIYSKRFKVALYFGDALTCQSIRNILNLQKNISNNLLKYALLLDHSY